MPEIKEQRLFNFPLLEEENKKKKKKKKETLIYLQKIVLSSLHLSVFTANPNEKCGSFPKISSFGFINLQLTTINS